MTIKQNDILIYKGEDKVKVLGVCGEICLLSVFNDFEKANRIIFTEKELKDNGWELLQEKWTPEEGERYWYFNGVTSTQSIWENDVYDKELISVNNVFKTEDLCKEAIEKIKGVLK